MRMTPNSQKVIPFNKGLNQTQSALELGSSELYQCINYELSDGNYAGLRLVDGYEIYDGTTLASETAVVKDDDGIVTDWSARETATAAILPPNSDNTPILAVFEYADTEFCIKPDSTDSNNHHLYRASGSSWVDEGSINTATGLGTQVYRYYTGRLTLYNSSQDFMVFCNGISNPFTLTGSGVTFAMADLDLSLLTSVTGFPTIPAIWENRIHIAYATGDVFFNQTGTDPIVASSWDTSTSTAGYEYFGDTPTNLVVGPSSLVVFCESMIKAFKKTNTVNPTGAYFVIDTYSDNTGALWNTAQMILGTIVYCDDRGISTLEATAAFGDFEASVISKNIQRSYEENIDDIIGAVVNRERNQYKVHLSTGEGFIVSFKADRTLKGITTFKYTDAPSCVYETAWLGGDDGNVYKLHEGAESFNNLPIVASFNTSYFTYNTPLNFKTFKRGLLELAADRGTEINFKPIFDYQAASTPKAFEETLDTSEYTPSSEWGDDDPWGTFYWQGAAESREWIYFTGVAANMSLSFYTSTRFYNSHVFHNIIVSYTQRSQDF